MNQPISVQVLARGPVGEWLRGIIRAHPDIEEATTASAVLLLYSGHAWRERLQDLVPAGRREYSPAVVLIASAASADAADGLAQGISCFWDAEDLVEDLLDAIGRAERGGTYFSASYHATVAQGSEPATRGELRAASPLALLGLQCSASNQLTPQELRVACLAIRRLTNREIAIALSITEHTVKSHLYHVCQKLRIHGRPELRKVLHEWTARGWQEPIPG